MVLILIVLNIDFTKITGNKTNSISRSLFNVFLDYPHSSLYPKAFEK